MEQNPFSRIILLTGLTLNVGVWTHHFAVWVKVLYAIIAGIAMLLGLINQWNVFYKNYHTVWIVVKIEHFFTAINPRKRSRFKKNKSGGKL